VVVDQACGKCHVDTECAGFLLTRNVVNGTELYRREAGQPADHHSQSRLMPCLVEGLTSEPGAVSLCAMFVSFVDATVAQKSQALLTGA
jgi:hypothetical protein